MIASQGSQRPLELLFRSIGLSQRLDALWAWLSRADDVTPSAGVTCPPREGWGLRAALPVGGAWRPEWRRRRQQRLSGGMAGAVSEARFAGLSLMQLHELLEDDAQLGDMVRGMEEVSVLGPGEGGAGTAR